MKLHKIYMVCLVLICLLQACIKDNGEFLYKGRLTAYTLKGFNGSNEILSIKLDTIPAGTLTSRSTFNQAISYLFADNQDSVKLTINELSTGKVVLERMLKKSERDGVIGYMYMDGMVSDMPDKPEAQDGKLRATWMFRPAVAKYTEPMDIVIGKFYFTPKVFEEIARVKNVKPNEFSETITLSVPLYTSPTQYNGQTTSVLFRAYLYKAGTNEFYTQGTQYVWDANSTIPVPSATTASAKLYIFSDAPTGTAMRFTKLLEL